MWQPASETAARWRPFKRITMDFEYSSKTQEVMARLKAFMDAHVYPNEERFHQDGYCR